MLFGKNDPIAFLIFCFVILLFSPAAESVLCSEVWSTETQATESPLTLSSIVSSAGVSKNVSRINVLIESSADFNRSFLHINAMPLYRSKLIPEYLRRLFTQEERDNLALFIVKLDGILLNAAGTQPIPVKAGDLVAIEINLDGHIWSIRYDNPMIYSPNR